MPGQPQNPGHVPGLQIREGGEIAVAKGEPVVIVANVERRSQAGRIPVHEAEVAAIGAAADAWRLEPHAKRQILGTLDVELDFLARGHAGVQQKAVVGGQELPVQEVFELPAVDGQEIGAGDEPEFRPERLRCHRLHTNQAAPTLKEFLSRAMQLQRAWGLPHGEISPNAR